LRCLTREPFSLRLDRLAPAGVAPQLKRDPLGRDDCDELDRHCVTHLHMPMLYVIVEKLPRR